MKSDWMYNILDFFWPHYKEEPKVQNAKEDKLDYSNISDWKCRYEMLKAVYAKEEERLKTVENKSSLMIGTMSVATSIIIALISFMNNANKDFSRVHLIIITIISLFLIIYLLSTLWHAIKTQRREKYETIGVKEIMSCKKVDYKRMCKTYIVAIETNQETINKKVDSMVLSQENFKRAIIVLGLYVLVLFYISIGINDVAKVRHKTSLTPIEVSINHIEYRKNTECSKR